MKKRNKIIFGLIIILGFFPFLNWQNSGLMTTNYTVTDNELPEVFSGFKVVQLSDVHSKMYADNHEYLVDKVRKSNPDIIVLTGDYFDYAQEVDYITNSVGLAKKLVSIAPTYYVTGNHEKYSNNAEELSLLLTKTGVVDLDNKYIELEKAGSTIELHGVKDPAFNSSMSSDFNYVDAQINELLSRSSEDNFKLLLSHRPELFSLYSDYNLTLTGHAHGGQVRLPFIGGLVAPNQGFFPKYDSGVYGAKGAIMIVSRGIANSIIPQRIFNRPEIVVITLKTH